MLPPGLAHKDTQLLLEDGAGNVCAGALGTAPQQPSPGPALLGPRVSDPVPRMRTGDMGGGGEWRHPGSPRDEAVLARGWEAPHWPQLLLSPMAAAREAPGRSLSLVLCWPPAPLCSPPPDSKCHTQASGTACAASSIPALFSFRGRPPKYPPAGGGCSLRALGTHLEALAWPGPAAPPAQPLAPG